MRHAVVAAAALLFGIACGPTTAVDLGHAAFDDPGFSSAASNRFACSTCHETGAPAGALRPGYTLLDSSHRPSYWGGNALTLTEAVGSCLTEFMKSRPLDTTDARGRALLLYLESLGDGTSRWAAAQPTTWVRDIVDVPNGDPMQGATLYMTGCQGCHGTVNTGAGRIDASVPVIPRDTLAAHGTDPITGARPITIEKVRHGKFFGVGGIMAPFPLELLDDGGLGHVLAYLGLSGLPASP